MKLKKYLVRYTARPLPGWAQVEVLAYSPQQAIKWANRPPRQRLKHDKPHDESWWMYAQPTAVEI